MDKIDQIYLERIRHPRKLMYWCWKEETWKELITCMNCPDLDNDGHCDDQEGPEEVQQ